MFSYLDTAKCFEREVGSNINKYEVCDNIDLTTILQVKSINNIIFTAHKYVIPNVIKNTS